MLRLRTWYESRLGRNDGNPLYVTACLKRMQFYSEVAAGRQPSQELFDRWFADGKHDPNAEAAAKKLWDEQKEVLEIDHFYPNGDISPYGTYDGNIWVDWGEDGLTGILPYIPIEAPKPLVYWASDTHINNGENGDSYPYRLAMAKKADVVFCAQKAGAEKMKADGIDNPIWLPHAFEPQAYPKGCLATKRYDVCFVGHVNNARREEALNRLFSEFPNFYYGQQLFEQAAEKFSESKVVFNISMTDDVNMRNFEVCGTGSLLLTNWLPTIEELGFKDGENCVLYRTPDEMIEKAKFYIEHDEEREKIARAGYELVSKYHTIQNRVDVMLSEINKTRLVVA